MLVAQATFFENPDVIKVLLAMGGILAIYLLVRFARRAIVLYISDIEQRYYARKIVTYLGYFLGILLLSLIFRTRLGGLTVFLGIAGAGVAFALQEVIGSIAGWIAITFGGFYNVGDRVQLGGIKGDVIDISVLRTTLMEIGEWVDSDLYTGRIVRIANSFIFKAPVFNFSGDFPYLWDEITVPVQYGGDFNRAREIMKQVVEEVAGHYSEEARENWDEMLRKYRVEKASLQPMVTLIANDNWLQFTIRYVVDFKTRRLLKDQLFTRLLEEFQATDGAVRFASQTIQIVGVPPVRMRVEED